MLPISKAFQAYSERTLGIRPNHARTVVARPAQSLRLRMRDGGPEMGLYIQRTPQAAPARHLLVITDRPGGRDETLSVAWPVLVADVGETPDPLEALRALCDRYGLTMKVGPNAKESRLIVCETFPGTPRDIGELIDVVEEEFKATVERNGSILPAFHGMVEPSSERGETDVTLAYVLDLASMKLDLSTR